MGVLTVLLKEPKVVELFVYTKRCQATKSPDRRLTRLKYDLRKVSGVPSVVRVDTPEPTPPPVVSFRAPHPSPRPKVVTTH